jgi:hypothetical protein
MILFERRFVVVDDSRDFEVVGVVPLIDVGLEACLGHVVLMEEFL